MTAPKRLASYSALAVALYAAAVFALTGASLEAAKIALWNAFPLLVPLLIVCLARQSFFRVGAAFLLGTMWFAGAATLFWGLVLSPGEYNHLVALFLPIYGFGFLAAAGLLLLLVSAIGLLGLSVIGWLRSLSR